MAQSVPLTETVQPDAPPSTSNNALATGLVPAAPQKTTLSADGAKNYVAGGSSFLWHTQPLSSLPTYVDDLTRDLGPDTYEQMMLDPQVQSCVMVLRLAVLANGFTLQPSLPEKITDPVTGQNVPNPEFEEARWWCDFCQKNLDRLPTPFLQTLHNMMEAVWRGNKFAEIIYEQGKGDDAGFILLSAIKPKKYTSVAYVVDWFLNLVGFLAQVPGTASSWGNGYGYLGLSGLFGDVKDIPNLLPRMKGFVLTHGVVDGDPRGTSCLRAAYKAWWNKQQLIPAYMQHLALHASPKVIGTTAEGAAGTTNAETGKDVTPEELLLSSLVAFNNGSAAALPFGSTIDYLQATGEGQAFLTAFDYFNKEIAKNVLGATLGTEQDKSQGRAAAQVHSDVTDNVVAYNKTLLEGATYTDVLTPLCMLNSKGKDIRRFVPKILLSDVNNADFAPKATAMAGLATSGILPPSLYAPARKELGLNLGEAPPEEETEPEPDPTDPNTDPDAEADPKAGNVTPPAKKPAKQ